jgi:hypothetical protein
MLEIRPKNGTLTHWEYLLDSGEFIKETHCLMKNVTQMRQLADASVVPIL